MKLPNLNQKGILPIIPLLIIGAVLLTAGGAYVVYQNKVKSPLDQIKQGVVDQVAGVEKAGLVAEGDNEPNYEKNTSRVVGASNGQFPYAEVDSSKVVAKTIGRNGGVLKTALPKGGTVYLVIPEDSVIGTAQVALMPYAKMPTAPSHGEVSDDLGYGVEVMIDSPQIRTEGYLVFDTQNKIAKPSLDEKFFFYCNANLTSFDPFICGRLKNRNEKKLINKDRAVITPIYKEDYNDLVFTRNTVPSGIDGVIVAPIHKGDVYIPQKMDQDLAYQYTKKTLGKYDNNAERVEAAALADAWGVALNKEQLQVMADSVSNGGDSYQEMFKAIAVGGIYQEKTTKQLDKVRARTVAEDRQNEQENEIEDYQAVAADFSEGGASSRKRMYDDARSDSRSVEPPTTQQAGAAMGGGQLWGFDGSGGAWSGCGGDLSGDLGNPGVPPTTQSDGAQAGDLGSSSPGSFTTSQLVSDIVNSIVNNPTSSVSDVASAMETAQQYGVDTDAFTDKAKDKIKKKLGGGGGGAAGTLNDAAIAQAFGMDDLAEELIAKSQQICPEILKKTLKNFAKNDCDQ